MSTAPAPPPTEQPQHLAALAVANRVRIAGAAICRELRTAPRPEALRRAADLLVDPPREIQPYPVGRFLRHSVPRLGPYLAEQLLAEAGLHNASRRIGPRLRYGETSIPLAATQRQRLAEVLRERADAARPRAKNHQQRGRP